MQRGLPSGTVTFVFTDVEGSTRLLHELGPERYAEAVEKHRLILRKAFSAHGGVEVDTQGDAFFVAFTTAHGALAAAQEAKEALAEGPIRVRIGIHTGTPHVTGEGYVGVDVHRAARIAAAGHGGQVLVSAATATQLRSDGLLDLGEHRLKDFADAVSIFQLGSEQFPPLKTISNTNLPRPASSFVGREQEIAEIRSLLRAGTRVLTLTGPGGSGKTRLAIEAAAELVPEFKAGVFWIGLAPLRDPALVTDTIGHALGAKDGLVDEIGERELLLVLDNLEQVVEAAPELATLVESCPNLRLLVTSRELLRVRGEVEYPVLPLSDQEAVELFCTRARAEQDETIAVLCRRLDNLPLALELAAARTNVLLPRQILDRISQRLDLLKGGRDADPRQQTLRATIEWSYELLEAEVQRLFRRLAVFRGGGTLETAERVCDADLDPLQALVDKSLVRIRDDERFWMLETIREYASERLEQSGEADDLRRRHAEHFLALAQQAEPRLRDGDGDWLDRFDREHDNVRAALDTFAASGEIQLALHLAGSVFWYWVPRGYVAEGRRRLDSLLRADERPTPARAKALNAAAELGGATGDAGTIRANAESALTLHRELGDPWGTALSVFQLGEAASLAGDLAKNQQLADESARFYRQAQWFFEQSIERFDELGNDHFALTAMYHLAYAHIELGDADLGRAMRETIVERARATGDEYVEALALGGLVRFAFGEDRLEDALSLLKEATAIWLRLGNLQRVALLLGRCAYALARLGRAETATRLLARSSALFEEIGSNVPWTAPEIDETLALIQAQLDEAAFDAARGQGRALTVEEAVALVLDEA